MTASDIAIVWDNQTGRGDWVMAGPDLQSGSDLESAILVSLFTDQRASDDYAAPPPSPTDKRGWWGDTYLGFQLGSRFWQRTRLAKTASTLVLIQKDAQDALGWLITLGAVASFDITAQWLNRTMIGLRIVAHMPNGDALNFRYAWIWGQIP